MVLHISPSFLAVRVVTVPPFLGAGASSPLPADDDVVEAAASGTAGAAGATAGASPKTSFTSAGSAACLAASAAAAAASSSALMVAAMAGRRSMVKWKKAPRGFLISLPKNVNACGGCYFVIAHHIHAHARGTHKVKFEGEKLRRDSSLPKRLKENSAFSTEIVVCTFEVQQFRLFLLHAAVLAAAALFAVGYVAELIRFLGCNGDGVLRVRGHGGVVLGSLLGSSSVVRGLNPGRIVGSEQGKEGE